MKTHVFSLFTKFFRGILYPLYFFVICYKKIQAISFLMNLLNKLHRLRKFLEVFELIIGTILNLILISKANRK